MTATLFDAFLAESNFSRAFKRVSKKKSQGGIDKVSVEEFAAKQHRNLRRLRREIRHGRYVPDPVQEVAKPKFNDKGEFRKLGLPTVADKVVQTALLQVVEPLAEKLFLDTSYAYRPRKGHRKAIRRAEHNLITEKQQWVVHQDIDNFFDGLDHDRLLHLFGELVDHDQRLVELVALWCRSGIIAKEGRWKDVAAGVRQGQVISPLLANLYLHELDVFVADNKWGWVRYSDDYLLQCRTKKEVREADQKIKEFLQTRLRLKLNRNDSPVSSLEQGFVFLGILFKGQERKIAGKKLEKMKRELAWLLSPKSSLGLEETLGRLQATTAGWQRYYGFLGSGEQFTAIEKVLEEKFTALIKQRITVGSWPKKVPAHLELPLPSAEFVDPGEARKRFIALWKMAQPTAEKQTKKQADKKAARRRKQHTREQLQDGEIFVVTPGHFVGKRGGRIVVRQKQRIISEVPSSQLQGLTMSDHSLAMSTDVVSFCCRKDIAFHLIDNFGNIVAVLQRPDGMRADLVLKQVALKDDSKGLQLARMFIYGKVKNQLAILKSYGKYKGHRENDFGRVFPGARGELERLVKKVKNLKMDKSARDFRNSLMGLEGTFASRYWQLIGHILPSDFNFPGRKRRGADDTINALLNYGYGILYSQALNAVTKAGLNAMAGFLHSYQYGKPVLTFDLVEEFRAPVVDKTIFSMVNRRIKFGLQKNGLLDEKTRKKVAAAVIARLGTEVTHRGRRDTLQGIIHYQAAAIRTHLYDKGTYRPYLSRW